MRDINTKLTISDRSLRQKINKNIQNLNLALDQVNLIGIYRTLPPKQENIHSSHHYMAITVKLITQAKVKYSSANAKELKSE